MVFGQSSEAAPPVRSRQSWRRRLAMRMTLGNFRRRSHASAHHDSKSLSPRSRIRLSARPIQFRSQKHRNRGTSSTGFAGHLLPLPSAGTWIRSTARREPRWIGKRCATTQVLKRNCRISLSRVPSIPDPIPVAIQALPAAEFESLMAQSLEGIDCPAQAARRHHRPEEFPIGRQRSQ